MIKKDSNNQDTTRSKSKKVVLGGRGLSVEFCVFCTAIRVSIDHDGYELFAAKLKECKTYFLH